MQYYDALTFQIVKMLLKNFTRLMAIGLVRDQCWDIPFMAVRSTNKKRAPEKQVDQYEVLENSLADIYSIENVQTREFRLKGLGLDRHSNEVAQLL
jgi:hypothetical protein